MVTWVIALKYLNATNVNKELRMLCSKDGELSVHSERNQLVITDWTSNLYRIAALLKQMDIPAEGKAVKSTIDAKSVSKIAPEVKKITNSAPATTSTTVAPAEKAQP
jgi:general secretion pathway protein D